MNIISFAFRNIFRNKRRSFITILAISIGFVAINLFGGYAMNTFKSLKISAIYGEGIGHLTVYKEGFLDNGTLDPAKYMISTDDMKTIEAVMSKDSRIVKVIPKLSVSGLVSNGINSTIFIAQGVNPDDEDFLKKDFPYSGEGSPISSKKPTGGQVAEKLAHMLNLKLGDVATIMANTLDGQMNAVDLDVSGIFNTGTAATNDKFILMPLSLAQSLYNTESVDRLVLLLNDANNTVPVKNDLLEALKKADFSAEIKTWDELSAFYSQVKNMFSMIFFFIFCIVLLIVVTSVINTMTMSVVERTQEIGTLRALGLQKTRILEIFGAEGFAIGFVGTVCGIAATLVLILAISAGDITYYPPGIDTPVKIIVDFVPSIIITSGLFLIGLSFVSAIIPSSKASRLNIVDALGHV